MLRFHISLLDLTQEVPCPDAETLASPSGSGAVWTSWEEYAGVSLQTFSETRPFTGAVLANIESAGAPSPTLLPPPDLTGNRTGEIEASGPFLRPGGGNVTGFVFSGLG